MATAKTAPVEERVPLLIPAHDISGHKVEDVFVGVNGVSYIIPAGRKVDVPKSVADEYYRSLEAKSSFYSSMDKLQGTGMTMDEKIQAGLNTTGNL